MSWVDDLWLRDAHRALRETLEVDAARKGEMIQFLLDEGFWSRETLRSREAQVARFNACLNPNKAEFFKLGEVWALMKRFGRHQLFLIMAADLGYEVRRIPTEERRHELLQRIAQASESFQEMLAQGAADLARLDRLPAASPELPKARGAEPAPTAVDRMGCP
ncbi:hypothetical protein ABWU93_11555 [Xanthomonas translucens pv. translucens]|uniref:hypothetical protein n=1 Tax=Xanthomonas campestris pv. translucens TaxID=343 RepID=UPI003F71D8C0